MPGKESYEEPFLYNTNNRQRSSGRGRGRSVKSRNHFAFMDGSRGDGRIDYNNDENIHVNSRKRIKASHYENFIKKYPGGAKLCILCKMGSNFTNCQGPLKWFSVKSKRGPGRPCAKLTKSDKSLSSFLDRGGGLTNNLPKVVTLKTEAVEPIKIKIDVPKASASTDMVNSNGVSKEDVESAASEGCGFYIHVECCSWTSGVSRDIEMFKAEKYLLKGLGQICSHCSMNGATVCCKYDTCRKKYHVVCALLAHCVPDITSSTIICSEHLGEEVGSEIRCSKCRENYSHNSMLHCFTCGSHTHQQCLPADVQMKSLVIAGWECDNCKSCHLCYRALSPQTPAIECAICSKPHHVECVKQHPHTSTLMHLQQWRCKICRNCTDCETEVPMQISNTFFNSPFVLCKDCYNLRLRGITCMICHKAIHSYNDIESILKCENCKNIVHPSCESVEPTRTLKEQLDPSNIYLCPVCRPGGKPPIVNRAMYLNQLNDNGHGMSMDLLEAMDETSQDSMSIASENDEMSVTPISSSHNSPGSSSLDSFYTVIPTKKGQRGLGIKLARPSSRKHSKMASGEGSCQIGSFQEKRDGGSPSEVVLFSESDQYTLNKDNCTMCGSFGAKEEGYLLSCQQCGKCCHTFCAGKAVTDIMVKVGWRCQDCRICESCSKGSDESNLLLCEDCDVSFHTYCLNPPLEAVPTGAWKCSWCVKCVKCTKTAPGLHSMWYQDYSVCGPCHSNQVCLKCGLEYNDKDFQVKCSNCEHWFHGNCENIPTEDQHPKKFVCSMCDDFIKKEEKPCNNKLQISSFGATKQALNSAMSRDSRISAYKQKDEREFEAEREEMEKKRLFGLNFVKALNKSRHEMAQKSKRQINQDKDQKINPLLEQGVTPPKDFSNSQMYQQIIREFTGSMHNNKLSSRRGRGRGHLKSASVGLLSPTKDPHMPRVRGRPRGSRNKASSQRTVGKGVPADLYHQMSSDDNVNLSDFGSSDSGGAVIPRQAIKSPYKNHHSEELSKEALLSTVQCLPQRYREIMMRDSSGTESQELKISRHQNDTITATEHINMVNKTDIETPMSLKIEPLSMSEISSKAALKRSISDKGLPGKMVPPIDTDMIKQEPGSAKMNNELAINFFGEDLVPTPQDQISPSHPSNQLSPIAPIVTIVPPVLTSPVPQPIKPGNSIIINQDKSQMKPMPVSQDILTNSARSSPTIASKSPKKEEITVPSVNEVRVEDIDICPESPSALPHPDALPEYNNRELVHNKPIGQGVEEEDKVFEAVSSFFSGLFGDDLDLEEPPGDGLDLEEPPKGSPVYNPPDPNAEQLTFKSIEDLDVTNELPSEVSAILESIETKPIGSETIDELERWNGDKNKDTPSDLQPHTPLPADLDMNEDLLKDMDGFDFPELFFDDLTMKKLETEQRKTGPHDRNEFDKILEAPMPAVGAKRQGNLASMWEVEEKRGHLGTIPQLLFANSDAEMNSLKLHCKDNIERYKLINKAWNKLSKDEKKIHIATSKKNKFRKGTEQEYASQMNQLPCSPSDLQHQQFDGGPRVPAMMMQGEKIEDQEMLRQNQRRQRLYERHPSGRSMKGDMLSNDSMMGTGWPRFPGPDDDSGSTVTVGPIPAKSGPSYSSVPQNREPLTPGSITPGSISLVPTNPGSMAQAQQRPMTPGPMAGAPTRASMTPRRMSPMNAQMMHQAQTHYMRHIDPQTGQWIHTGPHTTPLRHLPPQAILAQQNMVYNHPDQFNMQGGTPDEVPQQAAPPAPKTKKRTKKKKEKLPVDPPAADPQVNLENFPPHLRFGGNQSSSLQHEFKGQIPGHMMDYDDQFRQNVQMPPNALGKNFKRNNQMLKSPQTLDMERPKSLNITDSPNKKSYPNTPNKTTNKNSPMTKKSDDFKNAHSNDTSEPQIQQQKQNLRLALEQRKQAQYQQQHTVLAGYNSMQLHFPMNATQFVQFRLQQDWLKKYNTFKLNEGPLPQTPKHPSNLTQHQLQVMYSRLMEQYMFSIANSRQMGAQPGITEPVIAEEEKKPKPKKRKKKKTDTPLKKDAAAEKAKVQKLGSNLQPDLGNIPMNSPQHTSDNFIQQNIRMSGQVGNFQQAMSPQINQTQQMVTGGQNLGIVNQKPLNMRSPGPVVSAGPHVSHIPGQVHQQRLMQAQSRPFVAPQSGNLDPRYVDNTSRSGIVSQNHHFRDNFEIETQMTPKPKSKSKSKSKESLHISITKPHETPMQADSPRYQYETPRYQHQIMIEDNQEFTEPKTPQNMQPPRTPSSAGTPTSKDPFENPPLTPNASNSLYGCDSAKRRKRRTKAEMDELRLSRESKAQSSPRQVSRNLPNIVQPDIGKMVDIVVRGSNKKYKCLLLGSYGSAQLENNTDHYRNIISQIKARNEQASKPKLSDFEKEAAKLQKQHTNREQIEMLRTTAPTRHAMSPTVLTPQQEKIICHKFGITPAEAQQMYIYQQHQHMLSINNKQIKSQQIQDQVENHKSGHENDKSKILEQIRLLQESREKNSIIRNSPNITSEKIKQEQDVSISVNQQRDSIQLIFQRPVGIMQKDKIEIEKTLEMEKNMVKTHKPMLELTQPVPPSEIKQEYIKDASAFADSMFPRELPFAITGPGFLHTIKTTNPPTDENTTRVINLHKAFQMLSDMLGMKLKKDNLASLNELKVQNIIPGSLPHNLMCYNCAIALHPNKLKQISPCRPYYGIKDEHGATFCSDACLAQYYCKKFSSLNPEEEQMMLKQASTTPSPPLKPPPASPVTSDKEQCISSPGKRRRTELQWKYWKLEDSAGSPRHNNIYESGTNIMEMFKKVHEEQSLRCDVEDKRVCLLCGGVGDGKPNGASRLLNYRKDTWIHLNCALWSNDVYENLDGALVGVPQLCKRAQETVCSHCSRIGATVLCSKVKCTQHYHFLCARHCKCTFYHNKTVLCTAHSCTATGRICTNFTVKRRVVIQKDVQQLLINEAFKQAGDKVRVGCLIYHHPGHILNNTSNFHTRNVIYPFQYSVTRIFWSSESLKRRCKYNCTVGIRDERPLFQIKYQNQDNSVIELENADIDSLWGVILDAVAQLRNNNTHTLKLHTKYHPGTYLHGLCERNMLRVFEGLPGSDKLEGYTFCYGRIETVTLEHLVPINPTECARSEKYTKHTKRVGGHRQVTSQSTSHPPPSWQRELGAFHDNSPYQKSFNRASQYRKLKTEWKLNVLLRRSGIQGLGLYGRRLIERNTMVIEYVGQAIRTALCDRRESFYNSRNIGCYMFKIDDELAIDATLTGGPARYINHSCEPNCVAEIVTFEREKKIIIISNRKIRQGEELTYDYKFDFEDDSEKIPCNCGSVICRKWMN